MYAATYLRPFRLSVSSLASPYSHLSHSRTPLDGKFAPLKVFIKCLKNEVYSPVSKLIGGSNNFRTFYHYLRKWWKYNFWYSFALSAWLGSINLLPRTAYSTDGLDILLDGDHLGLMGDSDSEENRYTSLMSLRKFMVPFLLLFTVFMNWGQPIIIAAKVTLIFLTTKPSPLSVYLLVEQLRLEAIRQHPFIYCFKSLYAKKVDVADYAFLCLAKVEVKDQRYTLVGILGSWWVWPVSSWQEASSMLRRKILQNLS